MSRELLVERLGADDKRRVWRVLREQEPDLAALLGEGSKLTAALRETFGAELVLPEGPTLTALTADRYTERRLLRSRVLVGRRARSSLERMMRMSE